MSKLSDYIKLSALEHNLDVGETTRKIACPECPNNDQESGSFTVTREPTGLVYHCYRAKCGCKGFIPTVGYELGYAHSGKKKFEPKFFNHPLKSVPIPIRKWLNEMYGLTTDEIKANGIKFSYTENRLFLPIMNEFGAAVGANTKKLPKQFFELCTDLDVGQYMVGHKTIIYRESEDSLLDFPSLYAHKGPLAHRLIVLVEDKLSAIKVNRQARCVSLGGHHLSDEQVVKLATLTRNIIVALDYDTWFKKGKKASGLVHRSKYALYFNRFDVRMIHKDPKSMTDEEIRMEILGPARNE